MKGLSSLNSTKSKVKETREKFMKRKGDMENQNVFKFTCDVCKKTYRNKNRLDKHKELHNVVIPEKYTCNVCDKTYRNNYYLKRHILTHNERQHFCEVCNKGFTRKDGLKQHMITHGIVDCYYCCDTCDKSFARKDKFKAHKARHDKRKAKDQ